jgi:N6-L-threonylcarbamoyladenine synthase
MLTRRTSLSLSAAARLGRHCQFAAGRGRRRYRRLATTIDDAAGEAFRQDAKLLGLGYPGGPRWSGRPRGDPKGGAAPAPLVGSAEPHFSFAGLKSAVLRRGAGRHYGGGLAPRFSRRWSTAWSTDRRALLRAGGDCAGGGRRASRRTGRCAAR